MSTTDTHAGATPPSPAARPPRWTARQWLEALLDPGPLALARSVVPLPDPADREAWDAARKATGLDEALAYTTGTMDGRSVLCAAFDFRFLGGTLGVATAQILLACLELAVEHTALVMVTQSGGTRLQEGNRSFLQLPRVMAARERLAEAGRPLIVVAADPTVGGVAATLVASADVILAEPGARLGLNGPRATSALGGASLLQSAEEAVEAGLVDQVVSRERLPRVIRALLASLAF